MIGPMDETEIKIMTKEMFEKGGINNVLACIVVMLQCQAIIIGKLKELLEEQK